MGTHFLGQKRLDKLSRKYNHIFDCAYEFEHKNGYQILILSDAEYDYALLITKKKEYKLRRLPKGWGDRYKDAYNLEIDYGKDDIFIREWV